MINLSFIKSRFFIAVVMFFVFVAFTYRVYNMGYDSAVTKLSLVSFEAKIAHDEKVDKLEKAFAEQERLYLLEEAKTKKEFEQKYKTTVKVVTKYVKDNNYSDCNIGADGVQRVNDLLGGAPTEDK